MAETFTRREVNVALLATASAFALPGGSKARAPVPLFDFAIAGGFFHGLENVGAALVIGETLVLAAEPDNSHDPHAVAVHRRDGSKLGYIPRAANAPVADLLRQGATVSAEIVGRLDISRAADIPDDLVFTGFTRNDPRVRLSLRA